MRDNVQRELGIPTSNRLMHDKFNREFESERQYDIHVLSQSVHNKIPLLNPLTLLL